MRRVLGYGYGMRGRRWRGPLGWGSTGLMEPLPPPASGVLRVVAATDTGDGLNAPISYRFSRAPYFTIVDIRDRSPIKVESVPNAMAGGARGVGVAVGQWLLNSGVSIVIAPRLGPNISMLLSQAGIRVEVAPPGVTVGEALRRMGLLR
ncbi:MAG: dinitrogenase iron-molybdenum cofactor [Thermoprotei archaeon]|nr:MAG: dinitrogenase iron-molybdenum cofactor [Thermoprotei archaeon]